MEVWGGGGGGGLLHAVASFLRGILQRATATAPAARLEISTSGCRVQGTAFVCPLLFSTLSDQLYSVGFGLQLKGCAIGRIPGL